MTDDPDEYLMEQSIARKNPARVGDNLERIDWRLQYGIPELKFIGWVIVVLLALILWRVW
jgi:hypothetical protein